MKTQFESVLSSNAPNFYQFVGYFKNSNRSIQSYLDTRTEKAF